MVNKRILVVDDEEDLGNLILLLLKKDPFEVHCANNLLAAKVQLNLNVPDILILDNNLPDGLGIEFYQCNKILLANTSVIFMTAGSSVSLQTEALAAGMNYCLTKPFDIWSLREMILGLSKESLSYEHCR